MVSVSRDTDVVDDLLREGATPDEVWRQVLAIAARVRGFGCGKQADQLDDVAKHLVPPKLEGVVAELGHAQFWATREHALWLADRITEAAKIIARLMDDAEITGTPTVDAEAWLQSVGISRIVASRPTEPGPSQSP